jgi:hypothetical protein
MAATTIPTRTSGSDVLQQQALSESSRLIGTSIWRYNVAKSAFANLIERDVWPDGVGDTFSTVNYRRALAGTSMTNAWSDHRLATISSLATGASPPDISTTRGLPPVKVVQYTTQTQTVGLQWLAIESPRFNVQTERFTWNTARQMEQIYGLLQDAASYEYARHTQQEYFRVCATANRVFVGLPTTSHNSPLYSLPAATATFCKDFETITSTLGTLTETITGSGDHASTTIGYGPNHSVLTGGVLREIYARQIASGAADYALPGTGGKPVFTLVTDAETSDYLHREPGTRDDLRYSSPGELLKPLGVDRALNGFAHVIDPSCPRFTSNDGSSNSSVQVAEVAKYSYVTGDTSSGNGQGYWELNSSWLSAPYTMSFIVVKGVMKTLVPPPKSTLGSKTTFDPTQALGEFSFKNIEDEDRNPDKTMGYFRGVMDNATEPKMTEYGWCIIHRRPEPAYLAVPTYSITSGLGLQG